MSRTSMLIALLPIVASAQTLQAQRADTIVKLAGRPVHAGVATLVAEISIGQLEGADEYMFGDVSELAVGTDGSIYVYDRQVPALRKYDATGKFVRNIGRKGQGPGEYLNGGGLALGRDGKVYLWDTGNWRINVYSAAGESVGQLATPSGASGSFSLTTQRALTIDTAGLLYFRKPGFGRMGQPQREQLVRLRSNGTLVDTIDVPTFDIPQRTLTATSSNSRTESPIPFSPVAVSALSPHGYFVTGFPNRYAVDLRIPPAGSPGGWKQGHPVISLRRNMERLPVSNDDREAAKKRVEDQMRRTDPKWGWGGNEIPKVLPFFTGLRVGADGRVWVPLINEIARRAGGLSSIGGASVSNAPRPAGSSTQDKPRPALYDVFESSGTYLGQVQVPARVSTMVRRGDYVWGVAFDENDVASVKRYRIVWR
ncbi:MAG: 6-bladed beta-propeller [Longimicrobiales bacterium]